MRWNNDVFFHDRQQAAQEARHKALLQPVPPAPLPFPDRAPTTEAVERARSGLRYSSAGIPAGDRSAMLNAEREVVLGFIAKYPEFEKLGHDGVVQMLATMRTSGEHDVDNAVRDAGLVAGARADWHRGAA